jgi:peptide deformylase
MELVIYPNPILMKKTRKVEPDEKDLAAKIRKMFDIMYEHKGIGLAGPQAGWNVRLFVANVEGSGDNHEEVFINPRIVSRTGTTNEPEGCLSFPGLYVNVRRDREIVVEYEDQDFKTQRRSCDGLLARAIQHELDHLDNILLVHRMSHTDKIRNKKLLEELKEEYESTLEPGS